MILFVIFAQNYNQILSYTSKQMLQSDLITAFAALGDFIRQFSDSNFVRKAEIAHNDRFYDAFANLVEISVSHNGWFTREQVCFALTSWAEALTTEELTLWLGPYHVPQQQPKTVGLILAGNIPLVGFHDFLSVLISGHHVLVKTSSNDQHLLPLMADYLSAVAPDLENRIRFVDGKLENFDAVIATGSNNTARYFDYYFRNKPSIIRKSRNSVAVLNGKETESQLIALGEDIFRYFGLGCRNVSKIFAPSGYDFSAFFEAMYTYRDIIQYEKYANNYDYNKAVYLMSNFQILDNGFMTIKEDPGYASPISSVFYEYYDSLPELEKRLTQDAEQLQCIVSDELISGSIPFGNTQKPKLWDYADGIDTLKFLKGLS